MLIINYMQTMKNKKALLKKLYSFRKHQPHDIRDKTARMLIKVNKYILYQKYLYLFEILILSYSINKNVFTGVHMHLPVRYMDIFYFYFLDTNLFLKSVL